MSQTYIFHREGSFYPIELKDDADARKNAEDNRGTLKVTDAQGSRIVWEVPDKLTYLTLKKVEPDELVEGEWCLLLIENGSWEFCRWSEGERFLTVGAYRNYRPSEVTAIYELPK